MPPLPAGHPPQRLRAGAHHRLPLSALLELASVPAGRGMLRFKGTRGRLFCGCYRLIGADQALGVGAGQRHGAHCVEHGVQTIMQVLNPATGNWLPRVVPEAWHVPLGSALPGARTADEA